MLTSVQNPWIKQLRRLHRAGDRQSLGMFLCEGTHLLHEAIATDWPMEAVCFTQAWADKNVDVLRLLNPTIRQQLVTPQVLNYIATTETPDGIVAIAKTRSHALERGSPSLAIGVDRLQEPGNLGVLIRAAAASEADGIWISPDSVDPIHPKVLRASAGQWFRQPIIATPLRPWIEQCQSQSVQVLAAVAGGRCLWDSDLTKPTIFLLGNEGAGLSKSIQHLADDLISIPMAAGVESLNVGTTGALLLYEARRQRTERSV